MEQPEKTYKILLTGGGTGGSVTPLLAVAEELKNPLNPSASAPARRDGPLQGEQNTPLPKGGAGGFEFLWLGTKDGPERAMLASVSSPRPGFGELSRTELGTKAALGEKVGIKFRAIAGGKWRRYFSFKNFLDIFKIKLGFLEAFWIMLKWRPSLVMSAGSFISVPVVWAAWFLRVPVLIHQQDIQPGLANKLMAPFAKVITVTFEKSLADYRKKAVWTGNPVRQSLKVESQKLKVKSFFNLSENLPVVLILGGGTGAMAINELVAESLNELTEFCQVIHVTGKGKENRDERLEIRNYAQYEFLDVELMAEALNAADAVITRAGMGVLSELSYLKKPAIIIPMPDSHQEANAEMFKEAAIVLEQEVLNAGKFISEIKNLIGDEAWRKRLGEQMGRVMKRGANEAIVKIINNIL